MKLLKKTRAFWLTLYNLKNSETELRIHVPNYPKIVYKLSSEPRMKTFFHAVKKRQVSEKQQLGIKKRRRLLRMEQDFGDGVESHKSRSRCSSEITNNRTQPRDNIPHFYPEVIVTSIDYISSTSSIWNLPLRMNSWEKWSKNQKFI